MPAPAEKVAAFLAEARQAIAVFGGLNAAALTRLRAAAQIQGLSAREMSDALRSLCGTNAPSTAPSAPTPVGTTTPLAAPVGILVRDPARKTARLKAASGKPDDFPRYVALELKKARVLWPPIYERLIADGERFGLEDIEAMDFIEQVGERLAIPFVSASDAESRILGRAKEMYDRGELTPDANERLRGMAASVGMPGPRYDALVFQIAREPEPRREPWLIAGMPGGAVVGVGLFIAFAAAATVAITILGEPTERTVIESPPEPPKPKGSPTPSRNAVTQWGTPELNERLEKAGADALPGLGETWTQHLGSENAGVRADAYDVLLGSIAETSPPGLDALALCYALEPNDENAERILAVVRRDLPPPGLVKPTAQNIDRWFTACGLAARMLVAPSLSPERSTLVAKQLEFSLQVKPDPTATPAEFVTRIETLAAARIYTLVADLARTSPAEGAYLAGVCRPRFERFFQPDVLAPLETDIAAAVAGFEGPVPDTDLPRLRTLFVRVVDSNTAARVRLAGVYQGLKPGPVRDLLEEALLAKTGAKKGATPGETAANIRARADVVAVANTPPTVDRGQELLALARPALAAPGSTAPLPALQETLTLTHYSTLACALVGSDPPNEPRFLELLAKPPTLPGIAMPGAAPVEGTLSAVDEAKFARMLGNNDVKERIEAFNKLTSETDPDKLNSETAAALAKYLTRVLEPAEITAMNAGLPKVARSPALVLEFADLLSNASNDAKPGVQAALGHLIGRPTPLPDNRWKDVARRALLRRIADGGLDDALNAGAEQYRLLLIEQGILLGLDPADFALRAEPSTIFDVLIRHLASKLERDKLNDADRRFLDQLPHLVEAVDFQMLNDLQKCVVMQRAWLRVVCLYVVQRKPDAAERVTQSLAALAAADVKSADALVRLRSGEAALLQTWLLLLETL